MNPTKPPPLPPLLLASVRRIEQAVRIAAERSAESLTLSAAGTQSSQQRDTLLAAQFELRHHAPALMKAFDRAYADQLPGGGRGPMASDPNSTWGAFSLVDDRELDIKVQAERFGLEITHACEWELRELEAYVGSVLGAARAEREGNPLRPEHIGHGVIRALDEVIERPEVRKALESELKRSLASVLRGTYADIVAELRSAGVQPLSLAVRMSESRGENSRAGALDALPRGAGGQAGTGAGPASGLGAGPGSGGGPGGSPGPATGAAGRSGPGGTPIGRVDAGLMDLLRRLTFVDSHLGEGDVPVSDGTAAPAPANMIHVHRDELRRASTGQLDHMVIDVIGSLFDQILSDPKVPPQLARQIARLQLPVLRAALGDPSFFANRRHPVRQFINRIASLGNGFEDFDDEQAQTFVGKVRELVQEIVQGDFDKLETYEVRLTALEQFVAAQAQKAVETRHAGATRLLQEREDALRVGQHYARRLEEDLLPLAAPAFVRDFVVRVWSRVILKAAEREGVTSERVRALRQAGRELFMSVQPKTSPAQRKVFLAELPKLMQAINDGLNSIGWPDQRRREFFGQLMPAHAESLRSMGRVLDFNLMSRKVEQAFDRELPSAAEVPKSRAIDPVEDESADASLSSEEATRIGLLDESAIDWNGKVDIAVGSEPELRSVDLELPGLPAPAEPLEPASGRSLADHVQIGFSYQMHLDGDWQRVRLAHVSAGRTFFVFTRGQRHQRTISLTYRMLARLCDAGRMRAFEQAQLLERATARARRQLAAMGSAHAR